MNSNDLLLIILPAVIMLGNVTLVFVIARSAATLLRKLMWLTGTLVLTLITWFCLALPYIVSLAGSAASCLGQVGYPGCQRFEELNALFGLTLGNIGLLLFLFVLDVVIMLISWYLVQHPRGKGESQNIADPI